MATVLLLACGNPLRGDDGFGLHLAAAARARFAPERLRVLAAQQWTPEMAAAIARARVVIFADAAVAVPAGEVELMRLVPEAAARGAEFILDAGALRGSHHMTPEHLLACAQAWYGRCPERAYLLVAGAVTLDCCEELSPRLREHALPFALRMLDGLLSTAEPEEKRGQNRAHKAENSSAAPGGKSRYSSRHESKTEFTHHPCGAGRIVP